MAPVELAQVADFLDRLLKTSSEADREGNGLVLRAGRTVSRLAVAVDTSFDVISRAEEMGADMLVVQQLLVPPDGHRHRRRWGHPLPR